MKNVAVKNNSKAKKIRKRIIRFCADNNLAINPNFSLQGWAEKVVMKDGCPCVPSRKECPCEHAVNDILEERICKCGFIMDMNYYNEFLKIQL